MTTTTITFGPPATPWSGTDAQPASVPTLQWSAPWKHNVLDGLDRLQDPTYGLPSAPPCAFSSPPTANSIPHVMSTLLATPLAIAQRVAFAVALVETATATQLGTITVVGAGHIAQSILGLLPRTATLRQTSRLPLASPLPASNGPTNQGAATFTCDMSAALAGADLAILAVPPHALAPVIHLHAHVMQEAKLILVVCAGMAPMVVQRLFAGRGLPDVAKRVVLVAPLDDPVQCVARRVLAALVGIDADSPSKARTTSNTAGSGVQKQLEEGVATAPVEAEMITGHRTEDQQQLQVADSPSPEKRGVGDEAMLEWPGHSASQLARVFLHNLVGTSERTYDLPKVESRADWMRALDTSAVTVALVKLFADNVESRSAR